MEQRSGFIKLDEQRLHYLRMGRGPRVLICIHGYRNNAALFTSFSQYLGDAFTLVSIDLPHHGKSLWPDQLELGEKDLFNLVSSVAMEFRVDKVSLAGYSIGGRICLKIVELAPQLVDQVLLISSDGLVFNWFYYFVTSNTAGKKLFKGFLSNPGRYLKYIERLHRAGMVSAARYRFFLNYVESDGERRFLLKVWPGLRSLVPDRKKLVKAISSHHIPIYIFVGLHDPIIPAAHAERFKKGLQSVQLFILDKGHRVFDSESLPRMARCLITGTC